MGIWKIRKSKITKYSIAIAIPNGDVAIKIREEKSYWRKSKNQDEYFTDEEEQSRETERIRVNKSKKRKASTYPHKLTQFANGGKHKPQPQQGS